MGGREGWEGKKESKTEIYDFIQWKYLNLV